MKMKEKKNRGTSESWKEVDVLYIGEFGTNVGTHNVVSSITEHG